MRPKRIRKKPVKQVFRPEQIELGARYLAMSNMCTLDRFKKQIVDFATLRRYVHAAWEDAVTGYMESGENGYDESRESEAIRGVEEEIRGFRNDIKAGGARAAHWIKVLDTEVPYWKELPS